MYIYHIGTYTSIKLNLCSSITDIDECARGSDGCQHKCNNSDGSFICSCNAGYALNPDGQYCTGECYTYIVWYMYKATYLCTYHVLLHMYVYII